MKKIKILMTTLLVVIATYSCTKDRLDKTTEILGAQLFDYNDSISLNHVTISKTSIFGEVASISIMCGFADLEKELLFIESNALDLKIDVDEILFLTPSQQSEFNLFADFFGSSNKMLTKGLKSSDDDLSMYIPEDIRIINKNELRSLGNPPYNIIWNEDRDNPNNTVVIAVLHRGYKDENGLVRYEDFSTVKFVEDNGSAVITASDLLKFPRGSDLDIVIGRGNQEQIDDIDFTVFTTDLVISRN